MATDRSGRDALDALEENQWSMWGLFGRAAAGHLIDTPELFAVETPVDRVPYNVVMRTRFDAPDALAATIDERLGSARDRGVPLVWMVTPGDRDSPTAGSVPVVPALTERGLEHVDTLAGMIADLGDPDGPVADLGDPDGPVADLGGGGRDPDDGVRLLSCGPDEPDRWIDLVSWRYEIPHRHRRFLREAYETSGVGEAILVWLAVDRADRPISKAVVHLAGGVAGVYGVATRPEGRGRGLARRCTVRALQDAAARGYTTAVLHSTPMAIPLYERLGFTHVAPFELYATPAARS